MELNSTNETMHNNFQNVKNFTAEVSAITFQMFSSMIYQHKKDAFVREVISNAVDSHMEAGTDRPVRIVLPNYSSPFFIVEDFGIGMTEQDFDEIYTCYTKSTKRESNLGIGGFGVGSKSPFAYTNSFHVRIRKNGIEIMFTAFQNEQSEPSFTKQYERVTTEPDGVMVKVPVKQYDFMEIADLTAYYLSFFNMEFDVVSDGTFAYKYEGVAKDLEERGYALRPLQGYYGNRRSNVIIVMGGVPYEYQFDYESLDAVDRSLLQTQKIFVKFNIGDLKVALSRESLSLDENTAKLVKDRIIEIAKQLVEHLQEEVEAHSTVMEAMQFVHKKYGTYGFVWTKFTFRGNKMHPHRTFAKNAGLGIYQEYNNRAKYLNSLPSRQALLEAKNRGVEVHVVYRADEKHTKAIQNYSKKLCRNGHHRMVYYVREGVVSPTRLKRLKSLFDSVGAVYHTTEELKQRFTDPRVYNAPGTKRTRIGQEKVRGVSLKITGNNGATKLSSSIIDVSDDSVLFLRADSNMFDNVMYRYTGVLSVISGLLGEENSYMPIRIIREQSQNTKKLEKNGVQTISEIVEEYEHELNQQLIVAFCKLHSTDDTLQFIRLTDDQTDRTFLDSVFEKAKGTSGLYPDLDRVPFTIFPSTKEFISKLDRLDTLKKQFVTRYPLFHLWEDTYRWNHDDNVKQELITYINEKYHNEQQQKQTAGLDYSMAA